MTSYHHGNLRADLIRVGLQQVRGAGMPALGAREAAREVGVTPTAIYRHFRDLDDLRAAVSQAAREELARAMIVARDAVKTRDRRIKARRRFEAIGTAYVDFAIAEPGLFDAAFAHCKTLPSTPDDPAAWDILIAALDDLEAVGLLSSQVRSQAPLIAWTGIHGMASLLNLGVIPDDTEADIHVILAGIQRALGVPEA